MAWCGPVPRLPWGPASPQSICVPISKVFSVQEMVPPKSPYLPLPEVAPELLEVVQGQASAMLERDIWLSQCPQKGSGGPNITILPTRHSSLPTPKHCSSCSQVLSPISPVVQLWALATGTNKPKLPWLAVIVSAGITAPPCYRR